MVSETEQPRRPRFRKIILLALLAVYSPFLLGWFLLDCSHCRKQWAAWLPILPGVAPEAIILQMPQMTVAQEPLRFWFGKGTAQSAQALSQALRTRPSWAHHSFQGIFTIGFIACVVTAAAKCSFWRAIIGAAFLFSAAFAVLTYMLFRA